MKAIRITTLSVIALAAVAMAADDAVTFRRTIKEGDKDVYKMASTMDQEMDVSAFGGGVQNSKIETSLTMTYSYGKTDKGLTDATIDVTDFDFKVDGPMSQAPGMGEVPKKFKMKGKLSELNTLSEAKIEGLPGEVMSFASSSLSAMANIVSFPDKPVKVGETWDLKFPKNPIFGESEVKMKGTLVGSKDIDGVPTWEIKLAGPILLKIDPAEVAKANGTTGGGAMGGMKMLITGTVESKGIANIDKATMKLRQYDSEATMEMKVDLSDMGIQIPIKGKGTSVIKLSK